MDTRFTICLVVALFVLTGCGQHDPASDLAPSLPALPSSVPPATTRAPSPRAATRTPSRQDVEATRTAARPVITDVFTPSVQLLSDATIGITAVSFVDGEQGWIGYGASLLATNDGGHQWRTVYTATETIESLDFMSAQQGWAVIGAQVFATDDGGVTWSQLTAANLAHSAQVDFVDARHGWIITRDGLRATLLQTRDSGATWQPAVHPCISMPCFFLMRPTAGIVQAPQGMAG